MKKILSVMFALFSATAMYAQSHGNHLMLGVGGSYPQGVETTLSYEHETDYHNAWEYFGTMYLKYKKDEEAGHITSDSFWRNYRAWTVGFAYKPCVNRGRNHHGNVRVGVSCGSDLDKVITAGHIGYEHTYNLYNGWSVFFQVKEDIVIRCSLRCKNPIIKSNHYEISNKRYHSSGSGHDTDDSHHNSQYLV